MYLDWDRILRSKSSIQFIMQYSHEDMMLFEDCLAFEDRGDRCVLHIDKNSSRA